MSGKKNKPMLAIKEVVALLEWKKKGKQKRVKSPGGSAKTSGQVAEKERVKPSLGKRIRLVFWLVLLAVFLYLVVQVVLVLSPRMRTAVLVEGEMTDALHVEGFVSIESVPVESAGLMYYTVPSGQRVSQGDEIALVYESEEGVLAREELSGIQEEMALLQEVQETAVQAGDVDAILRETEEGLLSYLDVLSSGDYSQIAQPRNELTSANNRLQLATGDASDYTERMNALQEEANALEAAAAAQGSVVAPKSGYFVPSARQDRVPIAYEELASKTPNEMLEALVQEPEYFGENVVGHMVTDYQWRFFTVVPLSEVEKFSIGDTLEIRFTDVSEDALSVSVEAVEIDEEAQLVKVELLCEEVNPDILNLRLEEAEIIFSTQTGLRLEKEALRVIEGQTCVYEKFGNQAMLRPVEVLVDSEDYVLLSDVYETDVNEVELYDEIIVQSGGVELYDQRII